MSGINTIRNISRTYRHIGRYRRILHILLSNGFGYLFKDIKIHKPLEILQQEKLVGNSELPAAGYAERLRNTLVELGTTFVKLGQLLSCRPDILPQELVDELVKLRDNVPPFPFEQVRRIVREDLHGEIEDFFSYFDETPVGAASIAQGHRAVLKDGTEVFVKVQRPNIKNDIAVDLEILAYLAQQLEENNPEFSFLKPTKIIEEFSQSLERELDYGNELANMTSFYRHYCNVEGLVIPRAKRSLCSSRILTMDYIKGIKGNDYKAMQAAGIDLKSVAELGVKILLTQFFDHGFFHADPHPGNMFILPGPKICYVDFGVMGRLTQDERKQFGILLTNVVAGNNRTVAKIILKMTTSEILPDPDNLEREIAEIIDCHLRGTVIDLNVVQACQDIYKLCYRQKLCLKPHIYQMMKALGYADAMGRDMAPDFDIFSQIKPFVTKKTIEKFNVMENLNTAMDFFLDWQELMQWMPRNMRNIMLRLGDGRLSFRQVIEDMEGLKNTINQSMNRLCAGVVLCGMLISSAVVIHAKTPPLINDVSILGMMGFLMSLVVGIVILISIFMSGRQ